MLQGIDGGNILNFLYFSVVGTGLLYAFLFLAMEVSTATIGSVVFLFKPVLAPIFAWMLLGEDIPGRVLAGIVLIVCGAVFRAEARARSRRGHAATHCRAEADRRDLGGNRRRVRFRSVAFARAWRGCGAADAERPAAPMARRRRSA